MATVSIEGSNLVVDIHGLDKIWSFTSRLSIPLAHVRGARADPTVASESKGWRGPGTHIPGILVAGTFHHDGSKVFWDVRHAADTVVIDLEHETYRQLIIGVDDPAAVVEHIAQAIA